MEHNPYRDSKSSSVVQEISSLFETWKFIIVII